MHLPLRSLPVLGVTLALGVAACGGSSSSSSSGSSGSSSGSSSASPASSGKVAIRLFKYVPAAITVKAGTKVTWTNYDSTQHTATADSGSAFDTDRLVKGASKAITFSKPGTYSYHCAYHPFMHGTVVVK